MTTLEAQGTATPVVDGLGYQPALDGLRGVAVSMVLCFHGGWSWMTGGYVGVSVFFTLSGYLITSLLLIEHDRTGVVSLSRFYGRRLRRLLPASVICLAVVSVMAARGWFVVTDRLRGDIVAAALQVANWRALLGDQSYADLVAEVAGAVGPVDHFWSLSIEEQFYWVWPLAALVLFARVRSPKGRAHLLVGIALLAAALAPLTAIMFGPDATYWATPARLGEILVGAALAGWLRWRAVPSWAGIVGIVGIAVVMFAAVTWPASGGPAYSGWLPVFALASAATVLGVQRAGLLRDALSWRPLVALGRISYGVYLYHWPIFAVLTTSRVDVDGAALFALRIGVTLVVAIASYIVLEQPIRHATWAPARTFTLAGVSTASVVVLALVVVPTPLRAFDSGVDTSGIGFEDPPATTVTAPAATPAPGATTATTATTAPEQTTDSTTPAAPSRILLIGDSTAMALGEGMADWVRAQPERARLETAASPGCGLIRDADISVDTDGVYRRGCDYVLGDYLDDLIEQGRPDVVVIAVTLTDAGRRTWTDEEGPLAATDPRYIERRRADYLAFVDRLIAGGVPRVVFLTPAPPTSSWIGMLDPEQSNVHVDELGALMTTLPDARPGRVSVVDLGGWMTDREGAGETLRTDGLHLDRDAAVRVMDEFLADALAAAAAG